MKNYWTKCAIYSCLETCGQEKPCGNRYCSANPNYIPPTQKKRKRNGIGLIPGLYRRRYWNKARSMEDKR